MNNKNKPLSFENKRKATQLGIAGTRYQQLIRNEATPEQIFALADTLGSKEYDYATRDRILGAYGSWLSALMLQKGQFHRAKLGKNPQQYLYNQFTHIVENLDRIDHPNEDQRKWLENLKRFASTNVSLAECEDAALKDAPWSVYFQARTAKNRHAGTTLSHDIVMDAHKHNIALSRLAKTWENVEPRSSQ